MSIGTRNLKRSSEEKLRNQESEVGPEIDFKGHPSNDALESVGTLLRSPERRDENHEIPKENAEGL